MYEWIYDEEQFLNYWCVGILNLYTGKITRFEIYKDEDYEINDLKKFCDFILYGKKHKGSMIGFNNLSYDYPKIHSIIEQTINYRRESSDNYFNIETERLLHILYEKTQRLINATFDKNNSNAIYESRYHMEQIDLFKIAHYDNKAKLTSLKGLEIAIGLDNVEDMPFKYNAYIKQEDLNVVRAYNDNDLIATKAFYDITIGKTDNPLYKNQNKIALRRELSKTYNVNMLNKNDVAIGKEIVIQKLAIALGMEVKDLRKLRTWRTEVPLINTIPSFIEYKTPEMNKVLDFYKNKVITNKDVEETRSE